MLVKKTAEPNTDFDAVRDVEIKPNVVRVRRVRAVWDPMLKGKKWKREVQHVGGDWVWAGEADLHFSAWSALSKDIEEYFYATNMGESTFIDTRIRIISQDDKLLKEMTRMSQGWNELSEAQSKSWGREFGVKALPEAGKLKNVVPGELYRAVIDGSHTFRVYVDGRWNKYSTKNFAPVYPEELKTKYTPWATSEEIKSVAIIGACEYLRANKFTDPEDLVPMLAGMGLTITDVIAFNNSTTSSSTLQAKKVSSAEEVQNEIGEESNMANANTATAVQTKRKVSLQDFLYAQGVPASMVEGIREFRKEHRLDTSDTTILERVVTKPSAMFQGGAVWTAAIAAILEGHHILLEGPKATGKNVLCENLSFVFGRPIWDVSFHVNMDASSLIGADTFRNNEVQFRPGMIYQAAVHGGFAVLDEINMAKNEAVAVLHSVLDDRGVIDVPGYERIRLHPATRFIGTMNYGYSGTRELNEALVSRFVVVDVPQLGEEQLLAMLKAKVPGADEDFLEQYVRVFIDLQRKAHDAEISSRAVDLRGIIAALKLTKRGAKPQEAMRWAVVNKVFDEYERQKVADIVHTRISRSWEWDNVFPQ